MKTQLKIIILFTALSMTSCGSLRTAVYDQYSYQKTVEIKVMANALMQKATTPYQDNLQQIGALGKEIDLILQYEEFKPDNEVTYSMWQLLADPDRNLLVGFFKRWQEKGILNEAFIDEARLQMNEAMDLLLEYESSKGKEAKNSLQQFLN